jgi:hypothetical protein
MKLLIHSIVYTSLLLTALGAAESGVKTIMPVKITQKPVIDGKLDEPLWQQAKIAGDFVQFEPYKGRAAEFKTEVRVLYTDTYLYLGIDCFDPEAEKIIARLTKRDSDLMADDAIAIGLDTFLDHRTAYYFITNPLGTQSDGRLSDNGSTSDETWDGEWRSAAAVNSSGWSAEIAIPFSILKFKPGADRDWGLGIVRSIPRKLGKDTWTGPVEAENRVSQFGVLEGLELKKSEEKIVLIPHVITRVQQDEKTEVSAGLDARYAISQSLSSNLTVNPDFATIEADQEQINLSRFELQLSEKRNFFLEGSEIYSQRIRLFYSRRISDIHGGVKLYGKKDGYEYSAMSVQSKADDKIGLDSANFTVFRLRKDVFKSSTIGFLAANKLVGGRSFGSAGLDLVHFFSEKFRLTGQLALSYGDHSKGNLAFFLRPSFDSSTFHIHLRYNQLGENFADNANNVGFVSDDDRHELDSAIEKTWWIKKRSIDRMTYSSNYNIYWSKKNVLRSWQIDQQFELDLMNKFSFEIEYTKEYKLYEKEFHNQRAEFNLGYNTREWQSARISCEFGRNFDLNFQLYGASVNYKLLKTLSFEYELDRLFLNPDPEHNSTWIHVVRLSNYFTKDFYFKVFYQTNTAITKRNIQALFVYRFQPPFGTIQFAYQKGTARFGELGQQGHTLFLKISYVF